MRYLDTAWSLAVAALVVGCATTVDRPVPGLYVSERGGSIEISDSKIRFDIMIDDRVIAREYDLDVDFSGRLDPGPLTSVDAAQGVGRIEWRWGEGEIVAWDPKHRTVQRYRLQNPSARD